jgi:two-component system response regulator YesN
MKMITIMIADDEEIERIALKQIIERHIADIKVTALAENGRRAIELAARHQPDLILMDIKMPGINGLEAIGRIQTVLPDTKMVIVSSYDTFDYAQQAIRLGVKDYLLKPSKADVIASTIQKAVDEIHQQRRQQEQMEGVQETMKKMMPVVEADLVTQLLFDHVHDVHVMELVDLLKVEQQEQAYVMLITFESSERPIYERYKQLRTIFHQGGKGLVGALRGHQVPIISFLEKAQFKSEAAMLAQRLVHQTREGGQASMAIGIGSLSPSITDIRHSYYDAVHASLDWPSASRYRFYDFVQQETGGQHTEYFRMEKELLKEVEKGQCEQIKLLFQRLLQFELKQNHSLPQVQQRLFSTLAVIAHSLENLGFTLEKSHFVLKSETYEDVVNESLYVLDLMLAAYEQMNAQQETDIAHQMKQYILAHSHLQLSLEQMADLYGLTPHYLSKVFKEEFKLSYIDYLTKCRIEKAKRLMAESDKSLKEIAYEIGYNDPNYFSRVFKKVCQLSPTQYKELLIKQ